MVSGRINFTKEDIGGEILPTLTSGLYRDTLDALREYIQNAIDAGTRDIDIAIDPDVVSIRDTGRGMTGEEARRAIRLGISDKNPAENIGFRGIGIYSAFNLCNSLEIYTKSERDETEYRIYFNFERIRRDLGEEEERRRRGLAPELFLELLLEDSVFVEPSPTRVITGHGTIAILSGLLSEAYRRLNTWDMVVDYLQNVVPLPFSPAFKYGPQIQERFDKENIPVVPVTLTLGRHQESLYRPYTDSIFKYGGKHPPAFFDIKDKKAGSFGFAWVCVNDARETIKNLKVRGLLVKKSGFSLSDRRYLEPYFGRTVYSRRITGEVIVADPRLIPNAARSDFENNSARQDFLEALPRFTREVDNWANRIQESDLAHEVLADITIRLSEITGQLPHIQRDREALLKLNADLVDLDRQLKPQVKRLESIDKEALTRAQQLLHGAQSFVREALVSQRRIRTKFEEEIVKAVQRREEISPTAEQEARREDIPNHLLQVLDAYDLWDSSELRRVLQYFDESLLRTNLDSPTYARVIQELREYLEESL